MSFESRVSDKTNAPTKFTLQVFERGICLHLRHTFASASAYICHIRLHLPNREHLAIFALCGVSDKTNAPTKLTLQIFERGICLHLRHTFASASAYICGIRLHLRNPEHLAIFALCPVSDKTNAPTKFTLQVHNRRKILCYPCCSDHFFAVYFPRKIRYHK